MRNLLFTLLLLLACPTWAQKREHINPEDRRINMDAPTYVPMVKVGKVLEDGDSIQYMELNNVYVYTAPTNPARFKVLKSIQECHKLAQINLLNDTPVGALAVANNDVETGLEWSKQQAQQIGQNAIYILPSERMDRLKLDKPQDNGNV